VGLCRRSLLLTPDGGTTDIQQPRDLRYGCPIRQLLPRHRALFVGQWPVGSRAYALARDSLYVRRSALVTLSLRRRNVACTRTDRRTGQATDKRALATARQGADASTGGAADESAANGALARVVRSVQAPRPSARPNTASVNVFLDIIVLLRNYSQHYTRTTLTIS
jgi:hypothetical protein